MNRLNTRFRALPAALLLVAMTVLAACAAGDKDHRGFKSPQEAVDAMIAAFEAKDTPTVKLLFGPGSDKLLSSGDAVADANDRDQLLAAYGRKHSLVPDGEGRMVLQVGDNDWPFPVPIVQRDGRWYLDGAGGVDEVAFRRIGRNELGAIGLCRGYVAAQNEYASEGRDGDIAGLYAAHWVSEPGRHDGLYWETAEGEPPSPAGPFAAKAAAEGYRRSGGGERTPYHGYYYRMLYAQGANAPGGAKEYFEKGRLVNGFALIAWPAEYGVSGIKTFIVNQDGVVYEKDLGDDTAAAAEKIEVFDPDNTWSKVEAK